VFHFAVRTLLFAFLFAYPAVAWTQGTYYQALFHDSRPKRLADFPKLDSVPFERLGSQFTPADGDKGAILDLCQKAGMKVLYETNTGTQADHKKNFDAYSVIDYLQVADDADLTTTPAKVAASIAAWRPFMRADMKTFLTFSKGADPAVWKNTADAVALQLYIYKEGSLRKAWDILRPWRAAHTGKLWIHPYFGRNAIPYSLRTDPVWREQEYTPVQYNKALIWLALAAGIDDGVDGLLFYSAYDLNPSYPPDYAYILERWDMLPGYAELFRQIRSFDRFLLVVKPVPFDNGRVVGAVWTLPTGESLRVEVDTFEQLPDVSLKVLPAPVPPVVTNLRVTSSGPVVVEKLP
jgi:hypothetical protein